MERGVEEAREFGGWKENGGKEEGGKWWAGGLVCLLRDFCSE